MAARDLRVLGIDPGLTRCGIGVVDGPPARPRLVHQQLVTTPTAEVTAQRLVQLHEAIAAAIERFRPDAVAVERVLFSRNVRTAMGVGQAAGIALLAAAQAGVPVESYSPNEVKSTVAGYGSADKDAVGRMVKAQLALEAVPSPADVADALAIALTHLLRARLAAAAGPATAASSALAEATAAARASSRGGWEAVLDRPNVRIAASTDTPRRPTPGGPT